MRSWVLLRGDTLRQGYARSRANRAGFALVLRTPHVSAHRMTRALEGIRVLGLSRVLPGPFAGLVLADLGARVDKLEDPIHGDSLREMPPLADGTSVAFHSVNRGKRSLAMDLKASGASD